MSAAAPLEVAPEATVVDTSGAARRVVRVLAIALGVFEVWAVVFSTIDPYLHRALFLSSALGLAFLTLTSGPAVTRAERVTLWIWAAVAAASGVYLLARFGWIRWRWPLVHALSGMDLACGLLLLTATLEATRRMIGWALCAIIGVFVVYALGGHLLGGLLSHRPFSIADLLDHLVFTANGLFGAPLAVASTYVFFFILFGTALELSGGSDFFFRLAGLAAGRTRGGAAKVAVIASGLFGTISGSPTSNVVTTGAFTIPLMKRAGFRPELAAATEAVASTGGSIMPPVMGSAAFLMAEFTGISYGDIIVAAAFPAFLYYLGVFLQVHLVAARDRLPPLSRESTTAGGVIRTHGHHLVPLVTLVALLIRGWTPIAAAGIGLILSVAVSWRHSQTRIGPRVALRILELSAIRSVLVAVACAAAGVLVGAISATGLAGKIASIIFASTGGSLLLALIVTMTVCILLGMGMPTPSAYVLTAVLAGPPLAMLGLPLMSAHLFIVYFAVLSAITPPVAVAAYAAAGLAQANPSRVGFESVRLGLVAFVVPYFFVYQPALLLRGAPAVVLLAVITSSGGVLLVSAALAGFLRASIARAARTALFFGGLCLIVPGWKTDVLGLVLAAYGLRGQFGDRSRE